jgi:hypothetical protein
VVEPVTRAIPEGSLLLHIGPQKTGSTAIQHALHAARPALLERGVRYVGDRPVEKEAGWVALGLAAAIGRRPPRPEMWRRLTAEIGAAAEPRLCLSNEDFGRADDDAIERILSSTGVGRTHLVYVARRLDKVLPSHWQQQVKARLTASYDDFLREVLAPGAETWASRLVMGPQDVGTVLTRWQRWLPPDRMTVVVADEGDHAALLRAFEALLALPDGFLEAPSGPANRSMGLAETTAVRRVNQVAIDEDWSPKEYRHLVQLGIVKALKARPTSGPRLSGVPEWAFEKVADLADAQVAAIASSGATVIGDPETLRLRGRVEPAETPAEVTEVDLDLLADLVSGLRSGSVRLRPPAEVEVELLRDDLEGRRLLHLLAGRVVARFRRR